MIPQLVSFALNPVGWLVAVMFFVGGSVYGAHHQAAKDNVAALRQQVEGLKVRNIVTFKLQDARYAIQSAAANLIASMGENLDDAEAQARAEAAKPDSQCRPDTPDQLRGLQQRILVDPRAKHRAGKP